MSQQQIFGILRQAAPGSKWKLTSTRGLLHEGELGACLNALPHGSTRIGEEFASEKMLSEYHFKFPCGEVIGGVDYATLTALDAA
jgi:hypothetical protein